MALGIWARRIGLGLLVSLVALSMLGAIGLVIENKPSPAELDIAAAPAPATSSPVFTPDPRSVVLAKLMLLQDFHGYLEGIKVAGDWAQTQPIDERVTARQLQAAYDANEVAADELYKGKSLAVSGIILRTAKDTFGAPFVSLAGGSMFDNVEAELADETIAKADSLVPGQRILLVCTGGGLLVTITKLRNCQTESVLLALKKPDIDNAVDQVLHGQGSDVSDKMKFVIGYIYVMGTALPANAPCDTLSSAGVRACNRAYHAIPRPRLAALYDRLAGQIALPRREVP